MQFMNWTKETKQRPIDELTEDLIFIITHRGLVPLGLIKEDVWMAKEYHHVEYYMHENVRYKDFEPKAMLRFEHLIIHLLTDKKSKKNVLDQMKTELSMIVNKIIKSEYEFVLCHKGQAGSIKEWHSYHYDFSQYSILELARLTRIMTLVLHVTEGIDITNNDDIKEDFVPYTDRHSYVSKLW